MSSQKGISTEFDELLGYKTNHSVIEKPRMWIPDEEKGYVLGEVCSGMGTRSINLRLDSGETITVEESKCEHANLSKYNGAANLSDLIYLSQATALDCLRKRFEQDLIHTYAGRCLVVINPHKNLPIYTQQIAEHYQGKPREKVHPHVFVLANGAYRDMLKSKTDQSIVITGESGSGKTETFKRIVQYISHIAGRSEELGQQISATGAILEAFGNAKTKKSNNSSRFGKVLHLQFDKGGALVGAKVRTFMLEKWRVVEKAEGEGNFHIFSQIFEEPELRNKLRLTQPKDYKLLEDAPLEDRTELENTRLAMERIGIEAEEQNIIFRVVAAILHLGNVEFEAEKEGEGCVIKNHETTLQLAAELLSVDVEKLRDACTKKGSERVQRHVSVEQALLSLESLCAAMYESLFLWLVQKINKTLSVDSGHICIQVLDISGFDSQRHSFEQLCFNHINDRIQQFYNHHTFTQQQEEYMREKIKWIFIDFGMDEQESLDLVSKRPNGILAFLEEETFSPGATSSTLITKLHTLAGKYKRYEKLPLEGLSFKVRHSAGTAVYNVGGWLEMNKECLQGHFEECLGASEKPFVSNLFRDTSLNLFASEKERRRERTLQMFHRGSSNEGPICFTNLFKVQMDELEDILSSSQPHFVRCISTNSVNKADEWSAPYVLEQILSTGLLEGTRMFRKGFPHNMLFTEFVERFHIIGSVDTQAVPKEATEAILERVGSKFGSFHPSSQYLRFGVTKVFFGFGMLAQLEECRVGWVRCILTFICCIKKFQTFKVPKPILLLILANSSFE